MFRLNQRGISLPIVLVASALILANSYYFFELNKSTSKKNENVKMEIMEQSEQARISAYLADMSVCSATDNFKGKNLPSLVGTPITFDIIKPPAANNQVILKVGNTYAQGSQRVTKYQLESNPTVSAAELTYSLVVYYDVISAKTPKKSTTVKVPLYIQTDSSSNITRCYARPSQDITIGSTSIESAVQNACRTTASNPAPIAFLRVGSAIAECVNNVQAVNCNDGQAFNGSNVDTTNPTTAPGPGTENMHTMSCKSPTLNCPPSGATNNDTFFTRITDSSQLCGLPSNNNCLGSVMIRTTGGITCSSNCADNRLFQGYDTSTYQPICLNRTQLCSSGQFIKYVNPAGNNVTCEYVSYRNVSCASLQFATDLDPTVAGSGSLRCVGYSRTKSCAGTYNFASSFNTTGINCQNMNY